VDFVLSKGVGCVCVLDISAAALCGELKAGTCTR
jgi:hypothetical protein